MCKPSPGMGTWPPRDAIGDMPHWIYPPDATYARMDKSNPRKVAVCRKCKQERFVHEWSSDVGHLWHKKFGCECPSNVRFFTKHRGYK